MVGLSDVENLVIQARDVALAGLQIASSPSALPRASEWRMGGGRGGMAAGGQPITNNWGRG